MDIEEHWRQIFKSVVAREIVAAGGKEADGYRAVATRTGLKSDYVYQIYKDKPTAKPKRPSSAAMTTLRRVYSKSDDVQLLRLIEQIPSGDAGAASTSALEDWAQHASPRSREVIDQLRLMAQKNALGDEDWDMIRQLAERFQRRKK